jgi:hypothetical protein
VTLIPVFRSLATHAPERRPRERGQHPGRRDLADRRIARGHHIDVAQFVHRDTLRVREPCHGADAVVAADLKWLTRQRGHLRAQGRVGHVPEENVGAGAVRVDAPVERGRGGREGGRR